MEPNNGLSGAKIALLVDFDNVIFGLEDPGFDIELVVNALRERGTIVLGRVYGDWYRHNRHRRRLMEQGLELVETPAFGPVIKNSADIRIALDGFEIGLTQPHIDTFAIVSGDSDFLPLIKKLQSLGRRVLVICGNRFTSDMLRRNCNEFISYENLLAQSVGATEDATTLNGAFALLHRAMAALRERGTEIRGSGVKQMMLQLNPVFSERTFGCTQFRQFLNKAVQNGIVKLGARDKSSGEFNVMLPDEDEVPVQQKFERRQENRARRDDKIAQIAARIEAVPVPDTFVQERDDIGVDIELDATADMVESGESDYDLSGESEFDDGSVFADDAFGYDPESMEDAKTDSPQEIAQNTIARSELLSRGLRPSRRRFSGRNGRPLLDIQGSQFAHVEMDEGEMPEEIQSAPEAAVEAESGTPTAESRRLRSRRRRRNAAGQITVVSEETAPAPTDNDAAEGGATESTPSEVAPIGDASSLETQSGPPVWNEDNPDADTTDEEPSVESAEKVEAPADAISEIQTALDELKSDDTQALDPSKGIEVEADAPALPEEIIEVETADPVGVPAVQAKSRRRRPSRSKSAAPNAEVEIASVEAQPSEAVAPVETSTSAPVEVEVTTPPETEAAAPQSGKRRRSANARSRQAATTSVEAAPEASDATAPEVETPVDSTPEVNSAPEAESAPTKARRRRPSRAKKAAPDENSG